MCLAAIGILRLDAVLFVSCCFLSFGSFKTKSTLLRNRLRVVVDSLFMLIIAYALV